MTVVVLLFVSPAHLLSSVLFCAVILQFRLALPMFVVYIMLKVVTLLADIYIVRCFFARAVTDPCGRHLLSFSFIEIDVHFVSARTRFHFARMLFSHLTDSSGFFTGCPLMYTLSLVSVVSERTPPSFDHTFDHTFDHASSTTTLGIAAGLSNALGSIGGFACGSSFVIDHQRLAGAGYCYSASLPPLLAVTASKALALILTHDGALQAALAKNARALLAGVAKIKGLDAVAEPGSPIIHLRLSEATVDSNAYSRREQVLRHASRVVHDSCSSTSAFVNGPCCSVGQLRKGPLNKCPCSSVDRLQKGPLNKACHPIRSPFTKRAPGANAPVLYPKTCDL